MSTRMDEAANEVIKASAECRFRETDEMCPRCQRDLDVYYCENRTFAVRCKHCEMVTLVQASNPHEAAEKVGSKMQWRDGSIPPTVEGETVLVLISGKHRGIEFRYACEQAAYYRDEGWILEHYPEFTNARISHWMPLPELPEAIERELHEG